MLLCHFHYNFDKITVKIELHSSKLALRIRTNKLMQVVYPLPLRHLVHAIEKNRIIYGMTQYIELMEDDA